MSKHTTLYRRCVAVLLTAVLLCVVTIRGLAADLPELRDKQEQLEAQKEENDALLEELRGDAEQKAAYRDALYQQIDTLQQQLDLLRQQISQLDGQISDMEDQVAEKQAAIDKNMELFKERVRALYVAGDATAISILLGSTSFMDMTEKAQILKAVAKHDQELIDKLNNQLENIQADLSTLNNDKKELGDRKKDMESKGAELTELYEEAQQTVAEAENMELIAKANSELLGAQLEENEAAIAQLEEELRQQGVLTGGYVGTGSFIWPMPGYTYLTCYYGDGGHRGIDIAGGNIYGKPVVAADSGTVIYAGWNDSYGNCVFIDHGNGYETRYAHMSALNCSTGEAVSQQQVIGYVGSTGNSTGPHLHFEVIYQGGLTNPMGYF